MAGFPNGQRRLFFRRRVGSSAPPRAALHAFPVQPRVYRQLSPHYHSPDTCAGSPLEETSPGRWRNSGLIAALAFIFVSSSSIPAVSIAQSMQDSLVEETRPPLIAEVAFEGDRFFDDDQLALHIRTRPNRELLGIPGFTWWLWLYRFGANTIGGRIGKAFMASGEPPALLDSSLVDSDLEHLRLFYSIEGFREVQVEAVVSNWHQTDRVRVEYRISAGRPTFIRTLHYNGLDSLDADQKLEIARGSLLQPERIDEDNPLTYHPAGRRYSAPLLLDEGRRLMTVLRNSGYAGVARDSIHAVIYPVMPDSFDVTIDVKLGPRFRFGDVHFQVVGPEPTSDPRSDSTRLDTIEEGVEGGAVSADFSGENKLDFDVLTRGLQFRPGDWYDRSVLMATKRRLDGTGVFAFTEIRPNDLDSVITDASGTRRLPHRFDLQTRARHQIRFQTFMLQRSGSLADADNEFGTGLGITYNNLNLFGGGEAFQLRTTGSIAVDIGGRGSFTSAQWEVAASLAYPYLTFPFGRLDRSLGLYDARTRISITLLAARRDALRLILRGRGSARYRFELRHTRRLTSFVDLVDITVSNPDTMDGFQEIFLEDIIRSIDDPVQRAQIIEDYTRPQFNDALRYSFRSARLDPFKRDDGYTYEASFEIGGNMGYLLDRFVFSPDSLEGSLPGLPFFGREGSENRLIYRQYLRFSTDLRRFHKLNSRSVVAWKFILGLAQPTGEANLIPFDRRFYSGGSSSVRAWRLRELGPGSASFKSEADSVDAEATNILGGEIKLEGSIELRHTIIRSLLAADWIVTLFADAGNVWFGPRNPGTPKGRFHLDNFLGELGLGTGFGIRLAWDYLILRLDLAYKVHDPIRRGELFPDGLRKPVLQFGIGHTF